MRTFYNREAVDPYDPYRQISFFSPAHARAIMRMCRYVNVFIKIALFTLGLFHYEIHKRIVIIETVFNNKAKMMFNLFFMTPTIKCHITVDKQLVVE